jgi:hypothetical protein
MFRLLTGKRKRAKKSRAWTLVALALIFVSGITMMIVNRVRKDTKASTTPTIRLQETQRSSIELFAEQINAFQESLQETTETIEKETHLAVIESQVLKKAEMVGESGSGVAKILEKDGLFQYVVDVKLPPTIHGYAYQAFLVRSNPFQTLHIGSFAKEENSFHLDFSSSLDYKEYSSVWVSIEREESSVLGGEVVLRGEFQ